MNASPFASILGGILAPLRSLDGNTNPALYSGYKNVAQSAFDTGSRLILGEGASYGVPGLCRNLSSHGNMKPFIPKVSSELIFTANFLRVS